MKPNWRAVSVHESMDEGAAIIKAFFCAAVFCAPNVNLRHPSLFFFDLHLSLHLFPSLLSVNTIWLSPSPTTIQNVAKRQPSPRGHNCYTTSTGNRWDFGQYYLLPTAGVLWTRNGLDLFRSSEQILARWGTSCDMEESLTPPDGAYV